MGFVVTCCHRQDASQKGWGGGAEVVNLVVGGMGLDVVMYTKHWKDVVCAVNIFSPDMIFRQKHSSCSESAHSCVGFHLVCWLLGPPWF